MGLSVIAMTTRWVYGSVTHVLPGGNPGITRREGSLHSYNYRTLILGMLFVGIMEGMGRFNECVVAGVRLSIMIKMQKDNYMSLILKRGLKLTIIWIINLDSRGEVSEGFY